MTSRILYIFTRTPLHVGAGASVGAIDQPIQRERHTGFPIIPASALKGSFADQWPVTLRNEQNEQVRVTSKKVGDRFVIDQMDPSNAAWLYGSDDAHVSFAGSLLFSEARLLAFPIRSAKGSYAWITCPLMLQRAARDGVFGSSEKDASDNEMNSLLAALERLTEPEDSQANYLSSKLDLTGKIVLEEYCFTQTRLDNAPEPLPNGLGEALAKLVPDELWSSSITERLVILSNGMMSHFVTTACEIAQHVRINDETGTAEGGALFNQENVPADTLFYSTLRATGSRVPGDRFKDAPNTIPGTNALEAFTKVVSHGVFQFGGDASTGLGFCTVTIDNPSESS
jgi:CRISPR-associated protein Cmr4